MYNGVPRHHLEILESYDLSSDHSLIFLTYLTSLFYNNTNVFSCKMDIESYKYWIESNVNLNISLKTGSEIDDSVERFTQLLHEAAYLSSPRNNSWNPNIVIISSQIKALITEKRQLRKKWQETHHPIDKRNLNVATKSLTRMLNNFRNNSIYNHIKPLNPNSNNEYNLWKITKNIKRPQKKIHHLKVSIIIGINLMKIKLPPFQTT